MKRLLVFAAPLCLGTAAPVAGAETAAVTANPAIDAAAPIRYEWEAGLSHEQLTRGLPSWRSRYLTGERRGPERELYYGGLRETERYALSDREAHLGAALPAGSHAGVQLEAGFSDTHRVLPVRYGAVHLHYSPVSGWVLGGGWRRTVYDLGLTRVFHFGVDRYVGNERFSYTLYDGGPDGSGLSPSHRWQWAHNYGERSWIGIALTQGRETESLGASGFLTSRVSGMSLSGRHDLAPDWALTWDAGSLRQGDAYTRNGVRLGLRRVF